MKNTRPYISIIIPAYNAQDTVGRLVKSVIASKNAPPYEIIIVDDASKAPLAMEDLGLTAVQKRSTQVRIVRQKHNRGPAAARNTGAKLARGKFLLFNDSDVEYFPDTLRNLTRIYTDDPDVVAVTGVWTKEQRTKEFFPNFKALRDWSYWINERDKSGYYYLFSTRIASIKKEVFQRLGGFDERYPGALVEDIELTYRIARRYAIIFAPDVRVKHEFEGFWPIAKKYFLRAYYWTKLYARRKRFDPVATTFQEAVTALTGVGTVFFGVISLVSFPSLPLILAVGNTAPAYLFYPSLVAYILFLLFLAVHAFLIRQFIVFMYREKGMDFVNRGFFTGLILYCFIAAGAAWGKIHGEKTDGR